MNKEITDAFGLLSVLLVFVIGYFAAVLPVIEALIASRPRVDAELVTWKSRIRVYLFVVVAMTVLNFLVLAALAPITIRAAFAVLQGGHRYSLPGAGLALVDVYLAITLIGGGWLLNRLSGELRKP